MNAPSLQTLERLVDGELSPAEYRAAIAAIDAHPEQWQTLAGLFLESQALRLDLAPPVKAPVVLNPLSSPPKVRVAPVFAAAACLLLGLALGAFLAPRSAPTLARDELSPPITEQVAAKPELPEVTVPLYSSGDVDPLALWQSSAALPPGLVEQARAQNVQLQREFQVVPVTLADGSQAAFPVERVKFVQAPTY